MTNQSEPNATASPGLTIIIPWSNRKELKTCLQKNRSLLERPGRQLVIVNGGGDFLALRAILEETPLSNLKVVDLDGVAFNKSCCLNLGAAVAEEENLFFLDSDVTITARDLDHALACLHPGSFVTIRDVIETDIDSHPELLKSTSYLREKATSTTLVFKDGQTASIEFRQTSCSRSSAGLILVKKQHYLQVGGCNSELQGWGFEDYDLQIRLQVKLGLHRISIGSAIHCTHAIPFEKERRFSNLRNAAKSFDNYSSNRLTGTYLYDVYSCRRCAKIFSGRDWNKIDVRVTIR